MKQILAGVLAGLPLLAMARPATPEVIRYANPDGSVAEVRLFGNEDFNYLTDKACQRVLDIDAYGKIVPMEFHGRQLTTSAADLSQLRAEKMPLMPMRSDKIHRMAALDNNGRSTYQTTGEVPALVILLEYPDRPFTTADPVETFHKMCNEEGYSDYSSHGSARDYYIDASNGKFKPNFEVFGPVKLQHEARYYTGIDEPSLSGSGRTARFGNAIEEAVKALDGQIDFSRYDLDKDGNVDNIFFFYSGYGQADTGDRTTVWPHQADFWRFTTMYPTSIGLDRLYVDGVEVRTYACSNELNASSKIPDEDKPFIDGVGAFIHEYGHVLGLPDFYDTNETHTYTPKSYSIMDTGSYNNLSTQPPTFSAYEKWVCNWLEYTDAADGETYSLPALTQPGAQAVRLRIRRPGGGVRYSPEYYIIESRMPESWDVTLPQHGLLIWHIDYDRAYWEANQVNVGGNPRVEIIRSNPSAEDYAWPGAYDEYTFITPSTDVKLTPHNYASTFKPWISNISWDSETGTGSFEYNKYTSYPEDATVLHDNPTANTSNREVYLKWDAVDGADSYLLTVTYDNGRGSHVVYSTYDEFDMGNQTNATIYNIPQAFWEREFKAKVRVVKTYPSTKESNEITFVPASLEEGSGVDEIVTDATVIYGADGMIVAPAEARVFSVNGVETGKTNLDAGLYIVVCGGKSYKVIVR